MAVICISASLALGGARADQVSPTGAATMPTQVWRASAASDGQASYVFGGTTCLSETGCLTDRITRYDPASNTPQIAVARLPAPTMLSSAIWNGQFAFIFGGSTPIGGTNSPTSSILRYDPTSDTLETISPRLPTARNATAAIWDGSNVYIFGGYDGGYLNEIVRFNPTTGAVNVLAAQLPRRTAFSSAVFTGQDVYLFGGVTETGSYQDQVVRFNPASGTIADLTAKLPTGRYGASAVWTGQHAVLFGGCTAPDCPTPSILRFDPATQQVSSSRAQMPTRIFYTAATWDGSIAYIFGGASCPAAQCVVSNAITRYDASVDSLATLTFDRGRFAMASASTADSTFLFGGYECPSVCFPTAAISRFNLANHSLTTRPTQLPTGLFRASAVWTGQEFYIFGGETISGLTSEILRYDPSTEIVTIMSARLPSPRKNTTAIWDGQNAYILGGVDSLAKDEVVRFSPSTGSISVTATMPTPLWGSTSIWDGQNAYLFGGTGRSGEFSDQILRYTPSSNTFTTMPSKLPSPRTMASATKEGDHVYIFGGENPALMDEIVRYRISTGEIVAMGAKLTSARSSAAATSGSSGIYVLGGRDSSGPNNLVLKYRLIPGVPFGPQALRGPGAGQITITWQPPLSNTYTSPVTAYKIYSSSVSGQQTLLATTDPSSRSFTHGGIPNGGVRYYKIAAVNAIGEGPLSLEFNGSAPVVPDRPPRPSVYPGPGYGDNTIFWSPPLDDGGAAVASFVVYRQVATGGVLIAEPTKAIAFVGPNTFSLTDPDCPLGFVCYYKVAAVNAVGEGAQSPDGTGTGWFY